MSILLGILLLYTSLQPGKGAFPFVVDSSSATLDPSGPYEYIIIGAGASGCALATTLSQQNKVLVLERGGSPYQRSYLMSEDQAILSLADIESNQPFVSEDGVLNNRPRVLGGGTSVNAGFYSRASPDEIRRLGLDSAKANSSYAWVEDRIVSIPDTGGPFQTAFRDALLEAGVTPYNGETLDQITGTKVGGSLFKNGTRRPASDLLLSANASNILVVLHAVAQQVLISDDGKAYGVEFTNRLGLAPTRVYLTNTSKSEVILAASALGSPMLLMLSGIGPTNVLQGMGITPRVDLPVGKRIVDNPSTRIFMVSPTAMEVSLARVAGIVSTGTYILGVSSPLRLPVNAILQKVASPQSTGELRLLTRNADDFPLVKFNYFSQAKDLEVCVSGANIVEEVILSRSFTPFRTALQPMPSGGVAAAPNRRNPLLKNSVNASLEVYCRTNVATEWHYHGSCRVGEVVDTKYRVLGIKQLRVIDASVLDFAPGTNPQATIMMLGRYMGLEILQERQINVLNK